MAKDSTLHRVFCDNCRRQRERLELTQADVAKRLAVSQPTYAAIEAGRRMPGLDVVERVAVALQTTAAVLLSGETVAA